MARFKKASDIKVGCIGYGGAFNMGPQHLNQMAKAGMTPTAVCELNPERLEVAKKDFPGIETYTSVADMLKKSGVNLLAVITPHNTHAKIALQCLKAGRHVVCEKPMAITTAECDAMINEAKKGKLVVSTYHNRHWDGCILEAMERIGKGQIGDIVRVECRMGHYGSPGDWWRCSKSISGGILYDWGVHLLEYALQVIQSDITEVSGFAHNGFWGPGSKWGKDCIEDEANAVVRFKSGCMLTLRLSQIEGNNKHGMVEFVGTKGQYVLDGGSFEHFTFPENGQTLVTKGRNQAGQGEKFYQNIADHLVKGAPLVITGEWARRPIHILDLAGRSAKLGKAIPAKHK
ncbi:MAG: Gfo/Idh/MocA family oxidoreductase [Kiritimatiellaeota bacterium]|nr:Gfo/Idh/MocA family oxidoreductase [Kiritimatiellota bacterium]